MEKSKLFIGLGLGLLAGAAVGLYFATTKEEKEDFADNVSEAVHKARKAIKKAVKEGVEELQDTAEEVNKLAKSTVKQIRREAHT